MGNDIACLIDDCVKGMKEVDEEYYGSDRTEVHEKEENFYKGLFEDLNVNPAITSKIYGARYDDARIQDIKDNVNTYMLKN